MNNLRKLAALLLALLMLLSVAQPVLAATQLPNGVEIWYGWQVTRQPTCTREGERARKSSQGNIQKEAIPKTKHKPGPWVVTKEATCMNRARSEHLCAVCGHMIEWQWTGELAPHTWGEWENVETAPGEPVLKQKRTCQVCGATEEQEIDLPVLPDNVTDHEKPSVTLTIKSDYKGKLELGSVIEIELTIRNNSEKSIHVYGFDVNGHTGAAGINDDVNKWLGKFADDIKPGKSRSATYKAKVNLLDVQDGKVYRAFAGKYTWKDSTGQKQDGTTNQDSVSITLPDDLKAPVPDKDDTHLTLKVEGGPSGDLQIEDVIVLKYTATNDGKRSIKVSGISPKGTTDGYISDDFSNWSQEFKNSLEPGKSGSFTYKVVVNKDDINSGTVHREMTLSYSWEDSSKLTRYGLSDTISLDWPVTQAKTSTPPAISLTASLKKPGAYGEGLMPTILLTVENQSDITLNYHSYNGSKAAPTPIWPQSLAPHEQKTVETYLSIEKEMISASASNGYLYPLEFHVNYQDPDSQEIYPATADISVQLLPAQDASLSISVVIPGGSQEPYYANDSIPLHVTVTNTGKVTLYNVVIVGCEDLGDQLAPGKSKYWDCEATVFEEDVPGPFTSAFMAAGHTQPNWTGNYVESEIAEIEVMTAIEGQETDPYLRLEITGGPGEDETLVLGSPVLLKLTNYNEGNVPVFISGINVEGDKEGSDNYSGWSGYFAAAIDPGNDGSCPYTLVINSEDIKQGTAHREISFTYYYEENDGSEAYLITNTVPVDIALAGGKDHAELTLTCISPLAPGAKIGDQVAGKFTLTNTGNVPLYIHDVELKEYPGYLTDPNAKDDLTNWSAYIGHVLSPDDMPIVVTQYTNVVANDLALGKVVREVRVMGINEQADSGDNVCYSNWATLSVTLVTTPDDAEPLTVVKERVGEPADSKGYVLGETIHYKVTVTNVSDVTIPGLVLLDPIFKDWESPVVSTKASIAPDDPPWVVTFDYVVTSDDLEIFTDTLYNQAFVNYTDPETGDFIDVNSNIVGAPLYREQIKEIILTKECTNQPDNGKYYTPGEKIAYSITVENNTGCVLDTLTVYDPLLSETYPGGVIATYHDVPVGFKDVIKVEYEVKESDLSYDTVTNFAYYVAIGAGIRKRGASAEVTRPVGRPGQEPNVSITKTETSTPGPDGKYQLGDWIEYSLEVRNTGSIPFSEITLTDSLLIDETTSLDTVLTTVYDLAPSDGFSWTYKHQVTLTDVLNGEVVNYGVVDFLFGEGYAGHKSSEPVISYTGDGQKHDYPDPISGDSCLRVLTRLSETSAEYALTLCGEHAGLDASVNALIEAARSDTEKLSTYEIGINRWQRAIDQLYTQLAVHKGHRARPAILGSRTAFKRFLTAYETTLKNNLGKSDLETAAMILDQLRLRCVDLCYALHNAPDPARPDSMLTGTYESIVTTADSRLGAALAAGSKEGAFTLRVTLNQNGAEIERILNSLLADAGTPEEKASVFSIADLGFRTNLGARIARLIKNNQSEQRSMLLWQAAIHSLLDSDIEMYQVLYPDHPEIAAEIASREAREVLAFIGE